MPTFAAIALDRLLEPGSRNPMPKPKPKLLPPEPPSVTLEKAAPRSSQKKIIPRPHISPMLYATPEATPLPDSPSSFPPSPYIVNHKRRGPRLLKSFSQSDVGGCQPPKAEVNGSSGSQDVTDSFLDSKVEGGSKNGKLENVLNGFNVGMNGESNNSGGGVDIGTEELEKPFVGEPERDGELEDFFDLQDSISTASNTEVDDCNGGERSWKPSTPMGEYYDAFEEISSDGGTRTSSRNIEDELREMRLNLLLEIERRKQVEESIENLQTQWQSLSHQLSLVGLTLPCLPNTIEETEEEPNLDPAEELCRQVLVARFVAGSVGRGCSRAEVEMEMEPQIESKNFEISRLWDRLQYYEALNREMSQRNQEAVEMARQQRHKRKRRQKWFWRSIGLAVTLGAAAIAWSYIPASKPSPPQESEATASHQD